MHNHKFRAFVNLISIIYPFLVEIKSLLELKLSKNVYVWKNLKVELLMKYEKKTIKDSSEYRQTMHYLKTCRSHYCLKMDNIILVVKFKKMFMLVTKIVKSCYLYCKDIEHHIGHS